MKINGRSISQRTKGSAAKAAALGLLVTSVFGLWGCSDSEVGDVSLGLFTLSLIHI